MYFILGIGGVLSFGLIWFILNDRDPLLEKQAKYYSRWKQD